MKLATRIAVIVLALLSVSFALRAQQTAPSSVYSMTHLRVDLLLTEYNGEKKVSSLPYTVYVGAPDTNHSAPSAYLRMGVRVPILTGGNAQASQFTYSNVGTNIDCNATAVGDGLYRLQLTVARSAVYSPEDAAKTAEGGIHYGGNQPILRDFNSRFDLSLHDRETAEGMSATDPFNGHVMKVDVTIHVEK